MVIKGDNMGARYKGRIKNLETGEIKRFLYNPSDYNENKEIEYEPINAPGSSMPKFEYAGGGARTVSFNLFLYSHDVDENKEFIDFIEAFLPEDRVQFDPPPKMLLAYGNLGGKFLLSRYDKRVLRVNEILQPIHVEMDIELTRVE